MGRQADGRLGVDRHGKRELRPEDVFPAHAVDRVLVAHHHLDRVGALLPERVVERQGRRPEDVGREERAGAELEIPARLERRQLIGVRGIVRVEVDVRGLVRIGGERLRHAKGDSPHVAAVHLQGVRAHLHAGDVRRHVRHVEGEAARAPARHHLALVDFLRVAHDDVVFHLRAGQASVKKRHRDRADLLLAPKHRIAARPVVFIEAVHFRAGDEVGGVLAPGHEEHVPPVRAVRHHETALARFAEFERDDRLRFPVLGELAGRVVGDGLNHLRGLDGHGGVVLRGRLAVLVDDVELRRVFALLGVLDLEGEVARRRGGNIRVRRVVRRRVVAGVAPENGVLAGFVELPVGIRHVDGDFLLGVRFCGDGGQLLRDLRRAAVDHHRGTGELAGEEVARGRRHPRRGVGVHLEEQPHLRVGRAAVRVHPKRELRRLPALPDMQDRIPRGIVVHARLGERHVVRRVKFQHVALQRHLERNVEIGGIRLGERHVHVHLGLPVVGIGRHRRRRDAVHRHGDAGRQRLADLDGARDEVGDDVARSIEDVRGHGGQEQVRRGADRARAPHVERHARITRQDMELAHLARHAIAKHVLRDVLHLAARHDLGNVRVGRPHVKIHGRSGPARNRERRHAGIRRERPLRNAAPDARPFVGVCRVEIYGLHVYAGLVQVQVGVFLRLTVVHPPDQLLADEIGIFREI